MREQLLLDLAHLGTPIQSTAVYFRAHTRKSCHDVIDMFRGTTIVFLEHIFRSDFLEDNWETNGCVSFRIDCSAVF